MSWKLRPTPILPSGLNVDDLTRELKIPHWLANVLHQRMKNWKDTSLEAVQRHWQPSLKNLPDPFSLMDMDNAAERVVTALVENQTIAIYGDYDVDGTVGTAVLRRFFRMLGVEPIVYQPDRQLEGYGVNASAIEKIAEMGAQLLITVDCGITAVKEVARANELGMDVIICDHHEPKDILPAAYAVLDHKRADHTGPIHSLCGAGVAFYLALAVRSMLRDIEYFTNEGAGKKEPDLRTLLDLVAVATIADMVPLIEENRVLVTYGLEKLKKSPLLGLAALCQDAGVKQEDVSPYHIGFVIGPRINASGRLGSANAALELLCTEDPIEAKKLAAALGGVNEERMALQAAVSDAALLQAAEQLAKYGPDLPALVLAGEDWHEGVIGIAASRVVEKYHRPVVMITFATHSGFGKGSLRGLGRLDMLSAMENSSEFLLGFGGHKVAAGLSLERKNLENFRAAFVEAIGAQLDVLLGEGINALQREIMVDAELASAAELDHAAVKLLERLGPFGIGNSEPVFAVRGWRLEEVRTLKEKHLKMQFQMGESTKKMAGFWANAVDRFEGELEGEAVDIAFCPNINTFRNQSNVELRIKDLRAFTN